MTTLLAPLPVQAFKDSNGNPLSGGQLYTYVAGTSTLITTYTDVTATTPNTNPIILNSRGECNLWLSSGLAYKLVLQDSYSVLIWSVDQITSSAAAGANSDITSLTGLTTALSVAQGGTGAITASAAADALGAFRRGTLLGTVSQSSGVPTGSVIETATNANGTYTRFADGTQICTNVLGVTWAANASGSVSWPFPATFATNPYLSTCLQTSSPQTFSSSSSTSSVTSATLYAGSATTGASGSLWAIAIGRWF